jgi:ATP-dependent helicase YprA (DUF1998 family)
MELNNLKPADGAKHAKRRVSVAVLALVWARPQAVATRVKSRVLVAITRSALKAARCPCNAGCPSAVSSRTC